MKKLNIKIIMAGHFALWNISKGDFKYLTQGSNSKFGIKLGELEHRKDNNFPGWTSASEDIIRVVFGKKSGTQPLDRSSFPPHKYIKIPAVTELNKLLEFISNNNHILDRLCRPINLHLTALSPEPAIGHYYSPKVLWDQGYKGRAFIGQLAHGNVSIEIYHENGHKIKN